VTRPSHPHDRGRRKSSPHGRRDANDDGPTATDAPSESEATSIDGPKIEGPKIESAVEGHDTVSNELSVDEVGSDTIDGSVRVPQLGGDGGGDEDDDALFDFDSEDDPTIYRGDRPPRPSSSRRLSPTLMKVFQRKREQIGLSLEQLAKLTGIEAEELLRFEGTNGGHRLVYDHVVLLARVLGIRPEEMPGLRSGRKTKSAAGAALGSLETALLGGPVLTFEGKSGERFGGDLERLGTTPHFAIRLGDGSLGEGWPKGALLGLLMDASPAPGDVVLVRNKRNKQLALRRAAASAWAPLAPWQPSYPQGGDWLAMARLQVLLPRI
jgi:transcriptional regulator with XRE-family HTH domain